MAETVRAAVAAVVLSLTIATLVALGCAPSEAPVGDVDMESSPAQDEVVEPVAVAAEVVTERVPESAELLGVWLLEDLGGRGVMDKVQITISFDDEDRVSGSGGCNRYTGSYTLANDKLSFGPLAGTKMMCPEAVMDQEDRFHRGLGAVERVAVSGPFLLIFVKGSDAPLKFTEMMPDVID